MDDGPRMTEALQAFVERGPQGATLRLDEATDFAWDRVSAFAGSMPLEVMTGALGEGFRPDKGLAGRLTSDSALLVFLEGGEVVEQVVVGPPLFLVGLTGRAYTPDEAVLVVQTKDPGPYTALRFAD